MHEDFTSKPLDIRHPNHTLHTESRRRLSPAESRCTILAVGKRARWLLGLVLE